MRIDKLIPGDLVTLGFCGSDNKVHTEEPAVFLGHIGYGVTRRAEFAQVDRDNGNRIYEWETYRYNGGWAYGSSAERLRLLSLDVPGPSVPEDFPVKILKFGTEGATTCGTCHRSWDDTISTSWTPAPSGRCPFEYFHASTDVLIGS